MIAEFSIFHVNELTPISRAMTEVLKLVEASGVPYRLTSSTVSLEGTWEELFLLIRKCHERVREQASHVMTTISIEDEEGITAKIGESSRSLEEKITHPEKGWTPKIRNVRPSQSWG